MKKDKEELLNMDTSFLEKIVDEKVNKSNENKHIIVNTILIILLIISFISFVIILLNNNSSIINIISSLILTLFIIFYVITSITYRRHSKSMILFSSILLIIFLGISIFIKDDIGNNINFNGNDINEIIKWAKKNKIEVSQIYEYSDLVPVYKVINYNYDKKNKKIEVSISEGINPYKEVMIPNMVTWNSQQVIDFVKKNNLSNVEVEYISSDQEFDTVISQSISGTMRRNDSLKLVFSSSEELVFNEVNLIDLTNMSKFEVELYMKKNHLRYELIEEYSDNVKRGYVIKQSISKGEVVKVDDTRIQISLSKGKAIKIIDFKNYDTVKVTNWAIKNKMKVHFLEENDDTIKRGFVIKTSPSAGELVAEGSSVDVYISRGVLKMPKFNDINEFYKWAEKNNISYIEEHEFSEKVKAGEVISYSIKEGDIISNHGAITVKISDGNKRKVPDLKGLSKNEAIEKLEQLGLKYNFIYKESDKEKDTVLKQSISPGSEISESITITITLAS